MAPGISFFSSHDSFPFLLAAAMLLAGCGGTQRAYPGPDRASSETATVQGAAVDAWIEGGSSLVALRSIDGQHRIGRWNGDPRARIELPPGSHVLGVEYHAGSGLIAPRGTGLAEELEVTLRPGRSYAVYYSRNDGAFFVGESDRDRAVPATARTPDAVRCIPVTATRSRCVTEP